MQEYQNSISNISRRCEEIGVSSQHSTDVAICLSALQWITHVRKIILFDTLYASLIVFVWSNILVEGRKRETDVQFT